MPCEEWVHRFVHTLEPIAKNWYTEVELRHGTISWNTLVDSFVLTFSINEVCLDLDAAVRLIHTKVFDDQEIVEYQPDWKEQEANAVECYNLVIDEDDDPRNINIPESEGHCEVHGPAVEAPEVTQPLKMWIVNIGLEGKPKNAIIGDYLNEEMVNKVTQLLHEYQDLFLTKFSEIKGIIEAVEDILSWVEARSHVKASARKCQMSLLWCSQSY